MPDLSKLSDEELATLYQQAKAQPPAKRVPQAQGNSTKPAVPKKAAKAAGDVLASFGLSGVPKGVAGVFGSVGDLAQLSHGTGDWLASKAGIDTKALRQRPILGFGARAGDWIADQLVTSGDINSAVQGAVGEYHKPQTTAGRYAEKVGEFLPNAVAPGGIPRKIAQVVAPAVASQGARDAAKAMGAGQGGQTAAEFVGALAGGVAVPALARPRLAGTPTQQRPMKQLNKAAPQDVDAMRARQAEYEAAGIRPTFVDVVDEAGQGYLSGAALRLPSRDAARTYGAQKRAGLADEVKAQARRHMSDDPRNPLEIATDLKKARKDKGDAMFSAVRGEAYAMPHETALALRTGHGREAIAEAAMRERDPDTAAALRRLAEDSFDNPNTPITVGMADRISRVLYGKARAAARNGDDDLAATFSDLAENVRDPAKTISEGYRNALGEWQAGSKLMEAAERGEDFLKRDTDNFVADLKGATEPELAFARATGRRAIERAVGESPGAAPGVAERLFLAPEQRTRTAALMQGDAGGLEDGVRLAHESYRRAQAMSPSVGSPTAPKNAAADAVAGVIDTGVNTAQALTGNAVPLARQLLKAKGLNDQQAARLVQMATDPDQLDDMLIILEARAGRESAQEFLRLVREGGALASPVVPALLTSSGSR